MFRVYVSKKISRFDERVRARLAARYYFKKKKRRRWRLERSPIDLGPLQAKDQLLINLQKWDHESITTKESIRLGYKSATVQAKKERKRKNIIIERKKLLNDYGCKRSKPFYVSNSERSVARNENANQWKKGKTGEQIPKKNG